jgi:hypothetical protein
MTDGSSFSPGEPKGPDESEEPNDPELEAETRGAIGRGSPHGIYHGRGWTVDVGADASAQTVTIASMHEAMHERLQVTTIYGCIVILLQRLAVLEPDGPWELRAATMQRGCLDVHEQFATWMSAVPAAWDRERIGADFPRYLRHFDRAAQRLAAIANPYLAMHAMQAVARACMQPAGLAELAQADVAAITPSQLDRTMRPNYRLRVLDRLLAERGFGPITDYVGPSVDLSMSRFADDNDTEWDTLSAAAYEWCAVLLKNAGCPTLPYDGHLDSVRAATDAAVAYAGVPIGVAADAGIALATVDVGLFAVESEQMTLGPPLPAFVHPPGTDLGVMLAGDAERAHLFLAIRPRGRLMAQYAIDDAALPARDHLAVLRCSTDDAVELLDVSDMAPAELANGRAVVVSVSMRSLADEHIRSHWAGLLNRTQAAVLTDLRPSVHIPQWLEDPALRLRWTVFGAETPRGVIRILAFRLDGGEGMSSRLYLAPVSSLYASGFELWLDESPAVAGRADRDDTLTTGALVRFSLAHLTTEERHFDFHAGELHA